MSASNPILKGIMIQAERWLFLVLFLMMPSATNAQVIDGDNALNVIGQYDGTSLSDPVPVFTKGGSNDAPSRLGTNRLSGVEIDSTHHRLFVGDMDNNRVLVYNLDTNNELIDRVPDFVLGQSGFAIGSTAASQSGLNSPKGLAYDPDGDRLFVADSGNNRVLVYDVSTIVNGELAVNVLGQPDFTSSTGTITQSTLSSPVGLDYDRARNLLFVVDVNNSRVIIFDTNTISNGENAVNVLGQANFTTNGGGLTIKTLPLPVGIVYDEADKRLFVVQLAVNRVSVFDLATITDNEDAVNVLGQVNYTSSSGSAAQDKFSLPRALAYDSARKYLFVAEEFNNRVTVFDVNSITDGENAINVLGQSNFTTNIAATTQAGMNVSSIHDGFAFEPTTKKLYVPQMGNYRISIFDTTSITDGENAVDLLGQYDQSDVANPVPRYTKGNANNAPNRLGFANPRSVAVDTIRHRLFVADGSNNRVLVYDLDTNNHLINGVPDRVLGQIDFDSNVAAVSASGTNGSSGMNIAYDATNDRLFLSSEAQHRVLVFDTASITNGEAAVRVLGQLDFVSNSSGTTSSTFNAPAGLAYDDAGSRLFVTDYGNNRLLVYNVAPGSIANGQSASFVLGQADFLTNTPLNPPTQASLRNPKNVAYDPTGQRVFVVDQANRRVAVFNVNLSTMMDGEDMSNVIGQASFTTNSASLTATGMSSPWGVTFDSAGKRLFVSDSAYRRIAVYDTNTLDTTDESASNVLGQTNFTSNSSGTTRSKFSSPNQLAFEPGTERLYAAVSGRVMIFATSVNAAYSGSTFTESNANDGSISTSLSVTLTNTTFTVTSGTLTLNTDYTIANLPAGLTAVVTATSATTATITLTGSATAHESVNDVSNFTIAFQDAAFTFRTAATLSGSTKSNFVIDFANAPTATPTNTPTMTYTSTSTNTPTATYTPTTTASSTPTAASTPTVIATFTATETPTLTSTSVPTLTPSPTATVPDGTVRGRVVDDKGQPKAGVLVRCSRSEGEADATTVADAADTASGDEQTTVTDNDGRYEFSGLHPGQYQIQPDLDEYVFEPSEIAVGDGVSAPEIVASISNPEQAECSQKVTSASVAQTEAAANALYSLGLVRIKKYLKLNAKASLAATDKIRLRRSLRQAREDLNRGYSRMLRLAPSLPLVQFSNCPEGCTKESFRAPVTRYRLQAGNLRRLAFFVTRKADPLLADDKDRARSVKIRQAYRVVLQALKGVPRHSFTCRRD